MTWERRARLIASLATAVIVASMVVVLVVINRAALLIPWQGGAYAWVVLAATVIADLLLITIVYHLVHELVVALREEHRGGVTVPVLLFGLITLYTLVLWTILAPTLSRLGEAIGLGWLVDGSTEPESRLVRTMVVFAFVVLSYYWLVWRYRDASMIEALKQWFEARRGRREAQRSQRKGRQ